jgi:FkbM family methyltransferase
MESLLTLQESQITCGTWTLVGAGISEAEMLKSLMKTALTRFGYQVSKISTPPRATMARGIAHLREIGIRPKTIFDVGASNGSWSGIAMRIFPDAHYVLFEPQPYHQESLKEFNSTHPNVTIIPKAVGKADGITRFDASDPWGGALVAKQGKHAIDMPVTSLASAAQHLRAVPPYFVKLDTHGFEKSILDGTAELLPQTNALLIEVYNYRISDECLTFWEICAYLQERGFRPIDIVDVGYRPYDGTFWQADMIFIRSDWPGFTYTEFA